MVLHMPCPNIVRGKSASRVVNLPNGSAAFGLECAAPTGIDRSAGSRGSECKRSEQQITEQSQRVWLTGAPNVAILSRTRDFPASGPT
jgi:hypothetical protein